MVLGFFTSDNNFSALIEFSLRFPVNIYLDHVKRNVDYNIILRN